MPWKEETVKKNRETFVKQVLAGEKSKSALCREYGISRPTGDKWLKRFNNGEPMDDRSRAPFHTANRTDAETERLIVELRHKHPATGAVKLKRMLENSQTIAIPSSSTVNAILKRNGCITKEASLAATPCTRFERDAPNKLWQADFKGHFSMSNGERCHPLGILDDHSRFCLGLIAQSNEGLEDTRQSFEKVFREYGLPECLLCDNGNPWGNSQSTGFTKFEVWLMDLGVQTKHGRIKHPQTQGKQERFNGSLEREWFKYHTMADLTDSQAQLDEYRRLYNEERPHHALKLDVPNEHYTVSERRFPSRIRDWEYPTGYDVRKVKKTGYITYGNQGYYLSEGLGCSTIALSPSEKDGVMLIHYREFIIGRLDLRENAITSRKIRRPGQEPAVGKWKSLP